MCQRLGESRLKFSDVRAGFSHSAFVLRAESRLEHSPYYRKHIPRGELVELLSKALLFSEVEAHWRNDSMTLKCTNQFKLLEPHVCAYDPKFPPPPLPQSHRIHPTHLPSALTPVSVNGSSEPSLKRKASAPPPVGEDLREKRARVVSGDGGVPGSTSAVERRLRCLCTSSIVQYISTTFKTDHLRPTHRSLL